MMFHGAFAEKKEAVAKERKTKGAFIRGTPTKHGYRYIVMSPRMNPIKRKPKVKPQANPSELMIMGANPHEGKQQEIKIPIPGGEVTIRTNPEPRKNIYFGFAPTPTSKKELAESRRSFRAGVRRRVKEDREYLQALKRGARRTRGQAKMERFFHEVYGKNGRKNPNAEGLRERFTGAQADSYFIANEPHMPKGDYAQLGELLALYVKPALGGQVLTIRPPARNRPAIVSDESAQQIYFVGGDQDVSKSLGVFGARERGAGIWELGDARRIDYKQRKEHVPHPEVDEWRHEFGEESGVHPKVLFDANAKRLLLEGGEYSIREEGIVN